ncbi:hydrogenase maturation nickel metallochaperone HypA (plasmid) [Rhizobium sp. T1470]|uniref:hydrogenase maturation nickel metallochaperone HypA n=1 Tax=unclassified Rhizobium TaxID=2613769 RepID=UPI001AAE3B67|nr:hydrogenase maturation nickel metallochaperone HypA [Rhizobium sp. T1473]MCA0806443.1 hydrogenase maturation nickel metallochaperone HypA [Rhizobium sp. T1473]
MHEMSLCESIRSILEKEAAAQTFKSVDVVLLEIGTLSGAEPDALRFGFDVTMAGSVAANARLEIIEVPGQAWCLPCAETVSIKARYDPCPACGSHQLQVTGGEEMRIRELEVQ